MSDDANGGSERGPRQRSLELWAAAAAIAFGVLILIGSVQAGMNWGADGPKAGFFPFYIALFIIGASGVNFYNVIRDRSDAGELFATWTELRRVGSVVVPTAAYVALIPVLGMYVASFLLIGLFMIWLGRYSLVMTLPVAVGIPAFVFVVFELWFKIALPKGPIEAALGL
jgi:putative tricarboxylic transport membrane protein